MTTLYSVWVDGECVGDYPTRQQADGVAAEILALHPDADVVVVTERIAA
jgi:hypothetical protein